MSYARWLLVSITVFALAACGGGGGSSSAPTALLPGTTGGAAAHPAAATVPKYTIVDLGASVVPNAINSHNLVVGSVGYNGFTHAFSYSNGSMHVYGVLPGDAASAAADVNDSGVIVGSSSASNGTWHAVEFPSSGSLIDLGGLTGQDINIATGVSNAGEIVGSSGTTDSSALPACNGNTVIFDGHGNAREIFPNGGGSSPAAVNDSGTIVGAQCINGPADWGPFSYPVTAAFPANQCRAALHEEFSAQDVNDAGDIAGDYAFGTSNSTCAVHGFLIRNGTVTDIPGVNTSDDIAVAALNTADWVVGSDPMLQHATLFANGTTYDLNSLVTGQSCALWTLQSATDINGSNVIVGTGLLSNTEHGFMLIPQQ